MPQTKLDRSQFQFRDRRGERLTKLAGEIGGFDFVLDGCEDCEVFLLDHSAQLFVDHCRRCSIVLGPVSGSVFLRNCEDCRFKICCGQLRTRDCVGCDLLLLLPGRPTIEASRRMRFGPLLTSYEGSSLHLEASGLSGRLLGGEACRWRHVFDFSDESGRGRHWSCLGRAEAAELEAAFPAGPLPEDEDLGAFPRDDWPAATPSAPSAPPTRARPGAAAAPPAAAAEPAAPACAHCGAAGPALQLCAGCLGVRYCGAACQRAAWKGGHKEACRAAAAARAAAGR